MFQFWKNAVLKCVNSMLEKKIAVIVPAFNEELLIEKTLYSIPTFVDKIIVINDASKDKTLEIVEALQKQFKNICYKQ